MKLGVNIDHVATLRQVRGTRYPDPRDAALIAERAGADYITAHLREDRRHIQDHDIRRLQDSLSTYLNLEMAVTEEMLGMAEGIKPRDCCLVPEKRAELTTEGGLDVVNQFSCVQEACDRLGVAGIRVSLFVDADISQISAAQRAGAPVIEIHTGHYADALPVNREAELRKIRLAAEYAESIGLQVNAGHGLNYENVQAIAAIPQIRELNIGHAIIAYAVLYGFAKAVEDMKALINK